MFYNGYIILNAETEKGKIVINTYILSKTYFVHYNNNNFLAAIIYNELLLSNYLLENHSIPKYYYKYCVCVWCVINLNYKIT